MKRWGRPSESFLKSRWLHLTTFFIINISPNGIIWIFDIYHHFQMQEFTFLEEEDHGTGADAAHALAEVVTTIGHVCIFFFNFSLSFFSPPSDMWMQITSIINNRLLTVLFDQTFGDSHIRVVLRCCSGGWLALSTRSSRGSSSNKLLAFRSRTSSSKTMPLRWGLVFLKIGQLRLKPFQSGGTLMFWAVMGFFYFLLNIL